MRALERKLLRDLWHLRAQALAISAVVASGIAIFVAMLSVIATLSQAQSTYYERYRFADVFARVTRAPRTLLRRVEAIPGVAEVRARVITEVAADVPGVDEMVTLRLVSAPGPAGWGDGAFLNGVHLRSGSPPEREDEVVLNEPFAEANKLGPGSSLSVTIHGHRKRLRVVGVGMSPEYVFQIRGTELLPDDRRFGVVWMEETALASAMDMDGAFNDLTLSLAGRASEKDVIARLDDLLAPYGSLGAHGRDGEMSHKFLTDEFAQLQVNARVVPLVFLGVAAFLLNVVLARLIATQRGQIGTLKAFGYSDLRVGLHYFELILGVVLFGAALGIALGSWMNGGLIDLYRPYYRFPDLVARLDPSAVAGAFLIALGASSVGAFGAVRRATSLPPAEAMRPEPPPAFHASPLERAAIRRLLSTVPRMVLRNLLRRPARTGLATFGIALAVAIVVVGRQMYDSIDVIFDLQFGAAQRADATVLFYEARPIQATKDLARLPGVLRVEPFRALPATLRNGHLWKRSGLTGMPRDAALQRMIDQDGRAIPVPPEGAVVSRVLAEQLAVGPGDAIDAELLDGTGRVIPVRVAAVVDDLMGASATMSFDEVTRIAGGPPLASGAYISADPRAMADVQARLKETTYVASIGLRDLMIKNFRDTIAQNMTTMQAFQITFAVIIAIAVVYNSARIALSERARELATMRVLGFTEGEATGVLLGEIGTITVAAIPGGLLLGYLLAGLITKAASSELLRMPLTVSLETLATAALVVLLAAAASSFVVGRRVRHLDLVGVLKTRD